MRQLYAEHDELDARPLLSDEHAAMLSIGSSRRHFWSLRHLIELFETGSLLCEMTGQLGFASTPDELAGVVSLAEMRLSTLLFFGGPCSGEVPTFVLFFHIDSSLPHQGWIREERKIIRQQIRFVSNHMKILNPE
jgi:hypothetical protein